MRKNELLVIVYIFCGAVRTKQEQGLYNQKAYYYLCNQKNG